MVRVLTKSIEILPDRSLMPKIGQTGYSISQAISELVDNSIDAREEGKQLSVEIIFDTDGRFLEVIDNGSGMDEQTAANSMRLAHSSKKGKLGEFGLGLKTAATCLGEKFQIITTPKGSDEEYSISYDEDKWLKNGSWMKHEMKIKKGVEVDKSGTKIKIEKLRFKYHPNLPGNVRKDLASRFAPFIENGEVVIKVNTKWCEPDPLDLETGYYPPDGKEHFRVKLESGNEVWGWRGLLRKGSDKGAYGFRVFRRSRLIMQFAKIGFSPHPEARQIFGEIHLDHIPVTHNKREFIPESPLYQEIIKEGGIFWEFMRSIVKEARSSVRKTEIGQGILEKVEIQKENIMKAIKSLPELREYAFPDLKETKKGTEDNNEGKTDVEIEKRDSREIVTVEEHLPPVDEKERRAKKVHIQRTYFITVNGKRFKVDHDFVDLKTDDVLKDKVVDPKSGIHVFTNTAFPGFANTTDHVFYGAWNIAEAIAEVMVEENRRPAAEIMKIRDKILKKSAEITRELDEVEQEKKLAEKLKQEYEGKVARIKKLEEKQISLA